MNHTAVLIDVHKRGVIVLFLLPLCRVFCIPSPPQTSRTVNEDTPVKVSRVKWLPCYNVLRTFLAFPCCTSVLPPPRAQTNRTYPPKKQYPSGLDRHTLDFSGKMYVVFMLLVFVCTVCMFHVTDLVQSGSPLETGRAQDMADSMLPVCGLRWGALSLVDLALLAKLSYAESETEFAAGVEGWFANEKEVHLASTVATWDMSKAEESTSEVHFLHIQDTHNHSYVVLRSALEGQFLARDMQVWSESLLYTALSTALPVVSWWSEDIVESFVDGVGAIPSAFGSRKGLDNVTEFTAALVAAGEAVTLVGHGTAGGYARFVGAGLGVEAVVFNAPGHRWAGNRFASARRVPNEVAVVADRDVVASVDRSSGAVQRVKCDTGLTNAECSLVQNTVCALVAQCMETHAFEPATCT